MITKANAAVERTVRSYFTDGPVVDGFEDVEDQENFLHHVAWSATREMRAHAVEYVARRGQTGDLKDVKRSAGRRALRLAVPIWLESRYPRHDPARTALPSQLRQSVREGGMPSEQLLQLRHELRVEQFTHGEWTLHTLPPTNAFGSRPGPYAIGKREAPVQTLEWLDAAYQSELASVRLLRDLDAHQCSDLSGLVRFSSGLDRPETAPWSTYAHVLQEERARGGLAAYLVSRIPEVAPVTPAVKALSDEFRAYAHDTSLARLALFNNNNRIERRKVDQVETLHNARGYGILQFELNGPARSIAMGNKLLRQDEAESDRLRDVLCTPFARTEELRQATRGLDLHKLAKASTGIRFGNDARSTVPTPAAGHAGVSM
ncbi:MULTISPECIES: hypothetical protein [unclassified Pseudoclavibacter]|uniref:hypothetical protein n=1 Tax=unclassified Pseudoclavibacter TaxID=2615177 RepID=UPI001BACB6A1|nr:hypothetical protein [Pseudoclavibacter sp. Marseille-Q4354]MBS3177220.1 hypothetical protein [Pseudoclavibacter sp. Marseille-Q4354]